jgi:phytoene/squalene synthetase
VKIPGLPNYNRVAVWVARLGYGELVKDVIENGADVYNEIAYHSAKRWYSGIVKDYSYGCQ